MLGGIDKFWVGLGKVLNKKQVVIEESDIATLPEKTNLVGNDIFLMENSEDGFSKVFAKLSSVLASVGGGDMSKSTYDIDNDGIVDKAETIDDGTYSKTAQEVSQFIDSKGQASGLAALDANSEISSSTIALSKINSPDYYTLQHMQNVVHSTGWVSGGDVTDAGLGTINVASGHGLIRATNSNLAELYFCKWDAASGVALTDNSINYVFIDYNAGTPTVTVSTSDPTGNHTRILLARIYREGTDLHIFEGVRATIGDHAALMMQAMSETMPFARVSGAALTATGTRNFAISAGRFWHGLTTIETPAFDSSGTDRFTYYYRNGSGGWTELANQSQISNTLYDNGTGTLANISNNKYGVHWVYLSETKVYVIYGQGDYTLPEAQDATVPQPPTSVSTDARLVARIIILKSASSFASIDSAFMDMFPGSPIVPAASDTTPGIIETATTAETSTGTDGSRAVTPDGLAASVFGEKIVQCVIFDFATDVATGDGKFYLVIPSSLNGMSLVSVHGQVITAGTTGTTDVQIHNVTDAQDMLSTKLTIDSGETGSHTAATAAVINTTYDDVATNDLLRVDFDAVSTTAPKGYILTLIFRLP